MSTVHDTRILRFDDDLQLEARTVLSRTPEPQNPFEVAVILETLGYTDNSARRLGASSVFELGRRVYDTMAQYGYFFRSEPHRVLADSRERHPLVLFGQGLLYSTPWLAALAVLLVTGTAFWTTSAESPTLAAGLTLALVVALVASGCFVQAFARRATFYLLQGRMPLVRWVTALFLGSGALVTAAVSVGGYLVLEEGLGAYTPGTTRSFLAFSLAIGALQLATAPLYVLRRFGWLVASVVVGVVVLVVGVKEVGGGLFVNPFAVIKVQLASMGAMVVTAATASWYLLGSEPDRLVAERHVVRPRLGAVLRSVSPYALYGSAYFLLIVTDHLVAGGLWSRHYIYDRGYQVTAGICLLVVLPLFAYAVAVSERFPELVQRRLYADTIGDVEAFRLAHRSFYMRHVRVLVTLGAMFSVVLYAWVRLVGNHTILTSVLNRHQGLMAVALLSYVALSVGMLNSQLLFALSRPKMPSAGTALGTLVSLVIGGLVGLSGDAAVGAVCGLLAGTTTFALLTAYGAGQAFRRFDATYYGSF